MTGALVLATGAPVCFKALPRSPAPPILSLLSHVAAATQPWQAVLLAQRLASDPPPPRPALLPPSDDTMVSLGVGGAGMLELGGLL